MYKALFLAILTLYFNVSNEQIYIQDQAMVTHMKESKAGKGN